MPPQMKDDDMVFVAVPEDPKHGMNTLRWTLNNLVKNGDGVTVVHVHRPEPEPTIPPMGENGSIEDYRKRRRAEAEKKMDEYLDLCHSMEVMCKKLIIDKDDVAKGLQELIDRDGITKLVMGGAADKRCIEKMESLDSKTAIKLMERAASTCKIWFTCNGQLIVTRETNTTVPAMLPSPVTTIRTRRQQSSLINHHFSSHHHPDMGRCEDSSDDDDDTEHPLRKGKSEREGRYQHNVHDVNEKSPITYTASKNLMGVRNEAEESFHHVQKNFTLEEQKVTNIQHLIKDLNSEIGTNKYVLEERKETAVTEDRSSLHEKNDEITAVALPAETLNTEFSSSELMQAMEHFKNTLMGEGRFGKVYKGLLRNTDVAIKWLHGETVQGESDFNQKVSVLGRVRHPNLVTLIGVCREALCLVYEFLPNGNLQDRLASNNEMPPLTWQVRTKIICGMWSALKFLHSEEPQPVVHGDLKPSNVLLDANFVSKLGDFGLCMDGGDPTTQSDVHSFGVIVLQLLTCRLPPENVAKVIEEAMEKDELRTVLDPTAGNWPIALAEQLADFGLRCVKMSPEERLPDLVGDVWKELEFLITSGQDDDVPPNDFMCPITREVMENPHIAADGHTYEYEAIRQWIDGESYRRVRSPMTNLKLEHLGLTPNLTLKAQIKAWKEKQQQQQKQARSLVCDPHPVPVQSSQGHPIITPPEEAQSQSPPSGPLLPQVSSSPPTTVARAPSLTNDAGSSSLTQSPNTALPPESSSPPTTLMIPSAAHSRSRSRSTAPAPLDTSAAAAPSHRLNPLLPNHRAAAAPPAPPPLIPSSTFLPPTTGIRRRWVNGRLPSSSHMPVPGETSRIRGKSKHE